MLCFGMCCVGFSVLWSACYDVTYCRTASVPVRSVRQVVQAQAPPDRAPAPSHWREAVPLRQVRQALQPLRSVGTCSQCAVGTCSQCAVGTCSQCAVGTCSQYGRYTDDVENFPGSFELVAILVLHYMFLGIFCHKFAIDDHSCT